ncbi:MAG TPA: hypothetical protein VNT55_10275 [Baekduia sp.]|nr:hypothetical protein [Baekduia sp.]
MGQRTTIALAAVTLGLALPAGAAAATCPATGATNLNGFAGAATLKALNVKEASFGAPRPTGGAAHKGFVDWLDGQLHKVDGVTVKSLSYKIKRWDAKRVALTVGGTSIPVAGPLPYSQPTGAAGATAPLAYIPADQDITAANSAGKIVVRDLKPGKVPFSVFAKGVLGVGGYDPTNLLTSGGDYTRDFLTPVQPLIEAAAAAGAKGILFLRDLPRDQQRDFYAPYEGLVWKVPGAYLGSAESAAVRAAGTATATLTVDAKLTPTTTRTLVATIPGKSKQRLVVDSHTDGTNAVEDNGPVAMLAMVRYLAALPQSCRPRTLQFAFATGHFYQHLLGPGKVRDGGSEQVAAALDKDYDKGTVSAVMVLEHLGAYQYDVVDGRLQRSARHELALVPVTNSTPLREATVAMVTKQKLDPTAVIQGADAPVADRAPHFCSFGGEGSPYERHLLPTVATIAAPNILFDPAFGVEAIDFSYMHRQTVGYTSLLLRMGKMSQKAIAGDIGQLRAARKSGTPTCPPN